MKREGTEEGANQDQEEEEEGTKGCCQASLNIILAHIAYERSHEVEFEIFH
jgi:hypothetical protein